ncbi:MAG TPA: hypothetical protein QKA08_02435 [Candidatus Megaira endosymbiont of Nemacystus decipiens]|nr:hypothetical protein [Candidatus Megaera endosymbiont of Nemacystus decipiens]
MTNIQHTRKLQTLQEYNKKYQEIREKRAAKKDTQEPKIEEEVVVRIDENEETKVSNENKENSDADVLDSSKKDTQESKIEEKVESIHKNETNNTSEEDVLDSLLPSDTQEENNPEGGPDLVGNDGATTDEDVFSNIHLYGGY